MQRAFVTHAAVSTGVPAVLRRQVGVAFVTQIVARNDSVRAQQRSHRCAQLTREPRVMTTRIQYHQIAAKLDYTQLKQRLVQLQDQSPPKLRKSSTDVLAPLTEQLNEPTGQPKHGEDQRAK